MSISSAPSWLKKAAQGLAFWIGYQRSIYNKRRLPEIAISVELGKLIQAHLPKSLDLEYEYQYSKILQRTPSTNTTQTKVDLCIKNRTKVSKLFRPKYLIEIKREPAKKSRVDADLKRLANAVESRTYLKGYLCFISENKRPERFTNISGFPKKGSEAIADTNSKLTVVSVFKAAQYFNDKDKVHYVCLIEVTRA